MVLSAIETETVLNPEVQEGCGNICKIDKSVCE